MMEYRKPQVLDRGLAEQAFASRDTTAICEALVSVALYDSDWQWSQNKCLAFLEHESSDVRGLAATCLGHIARIHHCLDKERVVSALHDRLKDELISGQVSDALDDIEMFLRDES